MGLEVVVVGVEVVVLGVATEGLQEAKTSNRTMPRVSSDVASADHEAEEESTDASPNQREVIADRIDGRCSGNTKDRRRGDTADDAHEDRPEEVVGSRQEASDESPECADPADDQHRLNRGCIEEHDDRLPAATVAARKQ